LAFFARLMAYTAAPTTKAKDSTENTFFMASSLLKVNTLFKLPILEQNRATKVPTFFGLF
jgi:hypothetical protein